MPMRHRVAKQGEGRRDYRSMGKLHHLVNNPNVQHGTVSESSLNIYILARLQNKVGFGEERG